jgi:hypothetical protein
MDAKTEPSAPVRYVAFDPNTEIIGAMLQGTVYSMERETLLPLLRKHGFEEIELDKWYPLQPVLDLFTDIVNDTGGMFNMVAIGMKAGETFRFHLS